MNDSRDSWYDDAAGPLVRLYVMTGGRTRPRRGAMDVITLVMATGTAERDPSLTPEQVRILGLCRRSRVSVAEIAARSDLPLSVVRVLLADLLEAGHIQAEYPQPAHEIPSEDVLREVINGLRAL